jgi:hypothetical protein
MRLGIPKVENVVYRSGREEFIEWGFHEARPNAVYFSGGCWVGHIDFQRSNPDDWAILLVKSVHIMDTIIGEGGP